VCTEPPRPTILSPVAYTDFSGFSGEQTTVNVTVQLSVNASTANATCTVFNEPAGLTLLSVVRPTAAFATPTDRMMQCVYEWVPPAVTADSQTYFFTCLAAQDGDGVESEQVCVLFNLREEFCHIYGDPHCKCQAGLTLSIPGSDP